MIVRLIETVGVIYHSILYHPTHSIQLYLHNDDRGEKPLGHIGDYYCMYYYVLIAIAGIAYEGRGRGRKERRGEG